MRDEQDNSNRGWPWPNNWARLLQGIQDRSPGRVREKFRRLSGGLRINPARLGVGVTENSAAIAGGGDLSKKPMGFRN
ncbi:hypothetical protein ACFX16_044175 [Malus domestica]